MHSFILIVLWILSTLGVASFAVYLGRRFSVGFPMAIMAALVVIAAVLANKLVVVGGFVVPAGILVASTTYLITDLLSEKWGKEIARQAVWAGLYGLLLLVLSVLIAVSWEAPPFAQERADAFAEILGLTPRITIASIVAYLISQNHDVWAFHFWKRRTGGRMLWLRNNASTMVSQLIDSALFITIAFYGVFPVIPMILGQWFVKILIAALDTPFMYLICYMIDRTEAPTTLSFETPNSGLLSQQELQ